MNISFENKLASSYREIYHQTRKVQETTESVVPDVNDDIGKIASVQTSVLLKSKDLTGRGVLVSGEAIAALLYITENEKNVSYVRMTKPFSIEYELEAVDADTVAQIKLDIINCEARVLNPRKVSVTFEISGELSCFRQENITVETLLPANTAESVHAKYETAELIYTNAVCEKTFTLSEQFVFPSGKPSPSKLIMQKAEYIINDTQLIGTKLIVKGMTELSVCYLSEDVNYPVRNDYSTAFSQIIELGEEAMENCSVMIELSSLYCDIVSTISGEKALDVEIHAVMQIVCRSRKKLRYISDVYSNLMPGECVVNKHTITSAASNQQLKIIADERISVVDDCSDVLSVFYALSQLNLQPDKISAAVILDVVYRGKSGNISAVRRLINLGAECTRRPDRLIGARLSDVYIRPDGANIDVHMAMDVKYLSLNTAELYRVESVVFNEEECIDLSVYPTVSLVRAENEDIWELAKLYHSSVERICAVNDLTEITPGKLLLIPKSI